MDSIPVIDFSIFSLDRGEIPTDSDLKDVVSQMMGSLKTNRCFWVKNTGINLENVSTYLAFMKSGIIQVTKYFYMTHVK